MNFKHFILISLIALVSCNQDIEEEFLEVKAAQFDIEYSFFAAGHVYGNPTDPTFGLYEPFRSSSKFINEYPNVDFGVLTGDVVIWTTQRRWDSVFVDLTRFKEEVYIIPGNHDRDPLFYEIFDSIMYSSFIHKGDLMIMLDPLEWTIKGDQLKFLRNTIENQKASVKNIFIFVHELLWWAPNNEFNGVSLNYAPHYRDSTNYWTDIEPFLDSVRNPVYLIAGDLGASENASPYMYHESGNITYVASGMGGGVQDNFLIIDVAFNGDVKFNIMDIQSGSPVNLGGFENYRLPL